MLLSLNACVDDDLSSCPHVERLRIRFLNGLSEDADPLHFHNVSELVDVFVFDSQGVFYRQLSDTEVVITPDYAMETTLPTGTYTFVSWLNLQPCYETEPAEFLPGETHINDALLHFSPHLEVVSTDPSPLFFGSLAGIEVTGELQEIDIPVIPDNYRVNFKVSGPLSQGVNYLFNIRASNGSYKFDNSFAPCREFHYKKMTSPDEENVLHSGHTLMRLARDRNPEFSITNQYTGVCIYSHNLIDLILKLETMKKTMVDFSRDYIFNIELLLEGDTEKANMDATIKINGWHLWDEEGV